VAEERKTDMDVQRHKESDLKRRMLDEKEKHSVEVRKQMEAREFSRIDSI
jgi:hypothetical protein